MKRFISTSRTRATTLALIFGVAGGLALTGVAQQQEQQQERGEAQQQKQEQQPQATQRQGQQQGQQQQTAQQPQQKQQSPQQARQQQAQQEARRQEFQFNEQRFSEADLATFEMAYPTGDRESSVLLVEQRAPRQVRVGQSYLYEITLTNLTDQPLAGVTLIQNLGEGIEFQGSEQESQASAKGQQRWSIGELEAGASTTIRGSAIPQKEGASGLCVAVLYEPAMCSVVEVVQPQLRLSKQGPESAYICEDITYTYTVTNAGSGDAENVRIVESLPSGLQTREGQKEINLEVGSLAAGQSEEMTVQLAATEPGTYASRARAESGPDSVHSEEVQTQVVEANLRVAISGPEWEFTERPVTYQVAVTNAGDFSARDAKLTIVSDRVAGDEQLLNQDQPQRQGQPSADPQARQRQQTQQQQANKQQSQEPAQQWDAQTQQQQSQPQDPQTQQQRAQQGQQQQTQRQQTQQQARQQDPQMREEQQQQQQTQRQQAQQQARQQDPQRFAQQQDPQRRQQFAQQQGAIQGEENERQIGDLEPGETVRFNITLPGGTRAETLRVMAQATSICETADDKAMDIAQTEIRTIPALLLEMVDNNDPVRIGDTTTYIITVKNQGTGVANGVIITANLPQELEYRSASGDSEVQNEGQNEVQFRPIDLAPGEVAMWNIEAQANAPADVRVRVQMQSEYLAQAVPEVEPTRLVESSD